MRRFRNQIDISISAATFIWLALMLLVLPIRWILAAIVAAAFHELCHYLAIMLCGGTVDKMQIRHRGITMEMLPLSAGRELICALAGPLGGFLLLLIARWFPRVAVCGVFQSLYNLIPLYPLDGGRAVHSLMRLIFSRKTAEQICLWISRICILLLWGVAVYGCFWLNIGILPLILSAILTIKANYAKKPCKPGDFGVQ